MWIASRMGDWPEVEGTLYACVGFVPVPVSPECPDGYGRHFWLEFEDRFSRLVGDWTSGWVNGMPDRWRRDERHPWKGDHFDKGTVENET